MTTIGIPKEIHPGEKRVAATPQTILKLKKLGFDVAVESHAGHGINCIIIIPCLFFQLFICNNISLVYS